MASLEKSRDSKQYRLSVSVVGKPFSRRKGHASCTRVALRGNKLTRAAFTLLHLLPSRQIDASGVCENDVSGSLSNAALLSSSSVRGAHVANGHAGD